MRVRCIHPPLLGAAQQNVRVRDHFGERALQQFQRRETSHCFMCNLVLCIRPKSLLCQRTLYLYLSLPLPINIGPKPNYVNSSFKKKNCFSVFFFLVLFVLIICLVVFLKLTFYHQPCVEVLSNLKALFYNNNKKNCQQNFHYDNKLVSVLPLLQQSKYHSQHNCGK